MRQCTGWAAGCITMSKKPVGTLISENEETKIRTWEYEGPNGPVQIRRHASGSLVGHPGTIIEEDMDLAEHLGQVVPIRTSERGKELAIIAHEKRAELAWDALKETMGDRHGIDVDYNTAYKFLVGGQIEIADSPELGMAAVKAFPNVERALGIQQQTEKNVTAIQINLTVSQKALDGFDEEGKMLDAVWEEIG